PEDRYSSAAELRLDLEALAVGDRPLGAVLKLGAERLLKTRRRRRALLLALPVLFALAVSAGVLAWPRRPADAPAPPPPPAPAPENPERAKAEAVLLFLEQNPEAFEKGRALLDRVPRRDLDSGLRSRLDAARAALEKRREGKAAALLEDRRKRAWEALSEGDLAAMERVLLDWPEELRSSAQAEEARGLARAWAEEAAAPGRLLLEKMDAALSAPEGGAGSTPEAMESLLGDAARVLERPSVPPDQAARIRDGSGKLRERLGRMEAGRREAAARGLWSRAVAEPAPAGLGDALGRLAAPEFAGTSTGKLAREVLGRSQRAGSALEARAAALEGKAWAASLKDVLFVGILAVAPPAEDAFAPSRAVWDPAGGLARPDFQDLLRLVPDPADLSAWFLAGGRPSLCRLLGKESDPARALLAAAAAPEPRPDEPGPFWADLAVRAALCRRRAADAAPEGVSPADPVLAAWVLALRARSGDAGAKASLPARPASNPKKESGRDAFFADRLVDAWADLEPATRADPLDAEIAVLRGRILQQLSRPWPTLPAALLALSEFRRAFDLEPGLAAASVFLVDAVLEVRERWDFGAPDPWEGIAADACAEAVRLGQDNPRILRLLGETRFREGKTSEAASLLRRARKMDPRDPKVLLALGRALGSLGRKEEAWEALADARTILGADFPPWAAELLAELKR
ncbi:MAG: tetratricopeptide repeat protein, partial [Planctomycetes bacterium]|nr:tetratricopeptide repeat protein [Planctomycetota bacterium]